MAATNKLAPNHFEPLSTLLAGTVLDPANGLVRQTQKLLTELIVSVRLRPSQLISEKELAECLGASKTPVREALIRLESAGLVRVIPKSGTYVAPLCFSTYHQACFIRLRLEIGAVRRAAERRDDTTRLAELKSVLVRQANAIELGDDKEFFLLDQILHQCFFRMAGVPGVWLILDRTQSEVTRIRHLKRMQGIRRVDKVLADHRRIVDAISAGEPDAAEDAMQRHIGSLDSEFDSLARLPELVAFLGSPEKTSPCSQSAAGSAR